MQATTAIIIGQAKDLAGRYWDIREVRPTTHGFDVLIGWPQAEDGGPKRGRGHGGPRVVPTRALYRFWRERRQTYDGSIYDLPISRSTAKRVRLMMRLNIYDDYRKWWDERADDLRSLTLEQFIARHGTHISQVSVARKTRRESSAPVAPGGRRAD